jgi:hypothetical protein
MADITVTFGGREVVLKDNTDGRSFESDDESMFLWRCRDGQWKCEFGLPGRFCEKSDREPTPQAAVSAVESRLRELVRSINEVLGEKT